jgi:hypothetical protein
MSLPLNISKIEQRVLHALAQGGAVRVFRAGRRVIAVECATRDGYLLADCSLAIFKKLRRRRPIASRGGAPYRISALGLAAVRAQADNQ